MCWFQLESLMAMLTPSSHQLILCTGERCRWKKNNFCNICIDIFMEKNNYSGLIPAWVFSYKSELQEGFVFPSGSWPTWAEGYMWAPEIHYVMNSCHLYHISWQQQELFYVLMRHDRPNASKICFFSLSGLYHNVTTVALDHYYSINATRSNSLKSTHI